ncbi:MAG: ferredoxin III, nif-specific [Coriobacteriia bacterium]|nr:ferredoxin III, nif-specific [Coriobacteriia bacterium]
MSSTTRDGRSWRPGYIDSVDYDACIGCGRCYKVCGQGVLAPIAKPYEADDDDEYGDDFGNTVMSIADPGACIGCGACARVCAKKAQVHVAA